MITSLLIANRGEIACRIIRTCQAMGIRTIAVHSDADAKALHVRQADEAVHIGPSPARESYLVGDKIIAAAKATGAEAIHPGYGFLSENAAFAQAVIDAGLIWVGPRPASINAMGLKDAAKKLMADAGVPVTPGYMGEDQSPDRLAREAALVGYPVLIKAVAGGGGKGMRRVDDAAGFADALASCQREAASSFGNAHVLIEKYIQRPRHIEVQVFGDTHGNIVHLFERDCSLQRRHQKVIEEAPAPGMDAATREQLCAVAVRAAKAVNYVGAGTIEFIADASAEDGGGLRADRIWFMEMNTRLQVEHPVTEEITGVDLVEWQLRVASGEPLPKRQDELAINGWAMEARLYAEDPANGFLPSIGRLDHLRLYLGLDRIDMGDDRTARTDTGVRQGDVVSEFYDPMIAKLIVHAPTRDEARDLLATMCGGCNVAPVRTNANFLARLCSDDDFTEGNVSTGFIAERIDRLTAPPPPPVDLLFKIREYLSATMVLTDRLHGFRLNAEPATSTTVFIDGQRHEIDMDGMGPSTLMRYFSLEDELARIGVALDGEGALIFSDGLAHHVTFAARPSGAVASGTGTLLSPMPGRIIAVDVGLGDAVTKGQKLVTLEAMKMEHSLTAPFDGTVAELTAVAGGQVSEGTMLVRVEAGAI